MEEAGRLRQEAERTSRRLDKQKEELTSALEEAAEVRHQEDARYLQLFCKEKNGK